jgi:hypothetical protein
MERHMSTIFSLLENPLIQLFLIAGCGMSLSWLSEREEQRRVAAGLPYRPLKERILEGLGQLRPKQNPPADDVWVQAAKELGLPVEKVLLLKKRVLAERGK